MLIFFNFRPHTDRTNAVEGAEQTVGKQQHSYFNRRRSKNGNILRAINRRVGSLHLGQTHIHKKKNLSTKNRWKNCKTK